MSKEQITPHGGKLINRIVAEGNKDAAKKQTAKLPKLELSEREVCDLEMIATGAMSPLEGFMNQKDYTACLKDKRLSNKLVWAIPVTKSISDEEKNALRGQTMAALVNTEKQVLAILHIDDIYAHNKEEHAQKVYGTADSAHPGVAQIQKMGNWLVGGKIDLIDGPVHNVFNDHRRTPAETRAHFKEKGWKRIVAFQTRNPIHRAHEYLTKCALETVDGLMIHPLMGETKGDDVPARVRMLCYEALVEKYYQKDKVLLSVFPAAMRYAGPREAVWHAIVRKNYGCTHFIVGRDHAGCSKPDGTSYYGSYDAQIIFDEFEPEEIGIEIYKFEHSFYDRKTGGIVSFKTAPPNAEQFSVSGTKLRDMLKKGEIPPVEITRPEIAKILIEYMQESAKV